MAAVASRSTLFERTMDKLDLPKSDVNNLVMDYLITEGYPSAAEKFAAEANIELKTDQTNINDRVRIRDLILGGSLQEAIEAINELNEELLDRNRKLHFALLRLQLIEMIKESFLSPDQDLVGRALEFATYNLAPYTPENPQFQNDLERAMALLIVPKEAWTNNKAEGEFGALAELIHPDLRRKIARDVNEAILKSQGVRQEPNINYLIKARAWSEAQAREKKVPLPDKLDLGLDQWLQSEGKSGSGPGGDRADTEMSETSASASVSVSAVMTPGDADLTRYTHGPVA